MKTQVKVGGWGVVSITCDACDLHLLLIYELLWRNLAEPIDPKAPWLKKVLNFCVPRGWILYYTISVQPNSSPELASLAHAGCPALAVMSRTDSNSLCRSFIYYVSSRPVYLLIRFAALNFTPCLYVPPFKPAVNFWADWTLAGR